MGEEIIEHLSWLSADLRSSGNDVTARNRPWEKELSDVKHAQTFDPPVDTHTPVYIRRIWFSDCGVTRERADRPNADSLGLVSKIYFQIEMTVDLEGCPSCIQLFLLVVALPTLPNGAENKSNSLT